MGGIFVVIEGIEGSGKTTQAKKISNKLKKENFDVLVVREPGGTPLGEKVRKILLYSRFNISPLSELYLYLSARVQLVNDVIKPALEKGKLVIADRYIHSTVAYQGYGRGLDIRMVEKEALTSSCGVMPDITFLLDLPVEAGLKRVKGNDRFSRMDLSFHKKVREGYLSLKKKKHFKMKVIEADKPVEVITEKIFEEIKKIL